ncbi:phenylacetic acid degradation bifunctional protein PaaZ [Hymenobacter cellulosilyticus]|uniref:Phenylacetic acid degradation bifunctional protein PaaZ n=1 Tax=Hymenobacter cellulosilyticus TaxID=2932248 RepID=A0A8T9QAE1_9BACT|nr:phenylacetic acid degradation bifunctional protein PaaZ [Hymenobacter cellulosilyticus]UOQ74546.1 phenylacetic acid degradation bifunctional protein PaaZ [Hymenobacter cellulosilyticus]
MTPTLENYVLGRWTAGSGEQHELYDASTGEVIAIANGEGLDYAGMFDYARHTGNKALRKMTFHERGRMLKALALHLDSKKEDFYTLSYRSGATRADSWIDIEGGIGNLFANASLRRKFPDKPFYVESEPIALSKAGNFMGHHILVPKEGVAVHINAYNFPIWGMLEKIAVNLLAGMPAIVKPAVPSAYLTEAVVREIIASKILPEGALQLVVGSGQGILDHVNYQDVVTFTGSAETGRKLKGHPRILSEAVPFTMEADSLNAAVLGQDAVPGTVEFDLFIKEVRKEMTSKAGQKCTAIRRIIVPENLVEDVQIALGKALAQTTIGHPLAEGVRMGALAGREQMQRVRERVEHLAQNTPIVYGNLDDVQVIGGDCKVGAFMSPILLLNPEPFKFTDTHEIEAFGPVSTLMPYKDIDEAITLTNMGKGSLVCSVATNDPRTAQEFVLGSATHHGRILIINEEVAKESTGHGSPCPCSSTAAPAGPAAARKWAAFVGWSTSCSAWLFRAPPP